MVGAARAAGMEVFGLSEHFYRPRDPRVRYSFETDEGDWGRSGWPAFADDVLEEKQKAQKRGDDIRVLLGAEVEYLEGYREWTSKEISNWPLDYTVLSVHFVEADGVLIPYDLTPRHWQEAADRLGGPIPLYLQYYDQVLAALEWGIGDVLGHLDIIKIYAEKPVEHPEIDVKIDLIVQRCAERGVVIDLNARGLSKPCGEVYPSLSILERARRAGAEIVPGDDSHAPDQVGLNLDRALEHARQAGYRQVVLPERLGGRRWEI